MKKVCPSCKKTYTTYSKEQITCSFQCRFNLKGDYKQRLKDRSKLNETTGCIEWIAGKDTKGYGKIKVGKTSKGAHRLSYELNKGKIPDGYFVCHHCDNPVCINPDHLFVGTHQDNTDDRERKKRNNPPKGEKSNFCKITKTEAQEIYILYYGGFKNIKELSKQYKLTYSGVYAIINKKAWGKVIDLTIDPYWLLNSSVNLHKGVSPSSPSF